MAYYRTCPNCGAHLDSGEYCDCRIEQGTQQKAPASAANTDGDGVEQIKQAVSTSNDTRKPEETQW